MANRVWAMGMAMGACGGALGVVTMLAGCASGGSKHAAEQKAPSIVEQVKVGEVMRVAGDSSAVAEFADGVWRSGDAAIPTALPVGYPAPTPPGAVELKRYPVVRRAEIGGTRGEPDMGRTAGFWPLFNHIKRRDIAMTAPVEMEAKAYDAAAGVGGLGEGEGAAERDNAWAMSFLYREVEQGPVGPDGKDQRVRVYDTAEMVVVSRGFKGNYSDARIERELTALAEWIAADGRLEPAGRARVLMYNGGPGDDPRKYWSEVQIPVRDRTGATPG